MPNAANDDKAFATTKVLRAIAELRQDVEANMSLFHNELRRISDLLVSALDRDRIAHGPLAYSVADFAEAIGYTSEAVYKAIRLGYINAVSLTPNGELRIWAAEVERLHEYSIEHARPHGDLHITMKGRTGRTNLSQRRKTPERN